MVKTSANIGSWLIQVANEAGKFIDFAVNDLKIIQHFSQLTTLIYSG